jgi:hypothetical protein
MGKKKTSEEQTTFLQTWIKRYLDAQNDQRLENFWPMLFLAWFQQWPERRVLFPDLDEDAPLSDSQKKQYREAIDARKKVRDYFPFKCLI